MISKSIDEEKPLANSVKKHLANCPECQKFHNLVIRLDKELPKATAFEQKKDQVSESLHTRIMAEIHSQPKPGRMESPILLHPVLIRVAVMVIIVVIITVYYLTQNENHIRKNNSTGDTQPKIVASNVTFPENNDDLATNIAELQNDFVLIDQNMLAVTSETYTVEFENIRTDLSEAFNCLPVTEFL